MYTENHTVNSCTYSTFNKQVESWSEAGITDTGSWSHGDFVRSLQRHRCAWGLISPALRGSGGADIIRQDRELESVGGTGTLLMSYTTTRQN